MNDSERVPAFKCSLNVWPSAPQQPHQLLRIFIAQRREFRKSDSSHRALIRRAAGETLRDKIFLKNGFSAEGGKSIANEKQIGAFTLRVWSNLGKLQSIRRATADQTRASKYLLGSTHAVVEHKGNGIRF